ncbi:MAG: hypothetical protein QW735_04020 [archaeon]
MELYVCGKRTYEYVFEAMSKLNRDENIFLKSVGGSIGKGVEVATILNQVGIEIKGIRLEAIKVGNISNHVSEMELSYKKVRPSKMKELGFFVTDFVSAEFPIYHLLLDWWLFYNEPLKISVRRDEELFKLSDKGGNLIFEITASSENDRNELKAALSRSGVFMPRNWEDIAKEVSRYDDVILGIDTNILHNCNVSEHFLPSLNLIEPNEYIHTPNWILITVPSAVMHELEEAANIRKGGGLLAHDGRMGFRALQEIIELNQCADIQGLSIFISGEVNPILDTRVEIRGLRYDLTKSGTSKFTSHKSSSGDMTIRDQFKNFIKQINFHKGLYFMTSDKSNAALAKAEGLNSIYFWPGECYYEKEHYNNITAESQKDRKDKRSTSFIEEYVIKDTPIKIKVPIGKLIYELAVEFGSISIEDRKGEKVTFECDKLGRSLDDWFYRRLQVKNKEFSKLLKKYKARFNLEDALEIWNKLKKSTEIF